MARRRSLKLAAEELGVSQSAVSHQIRELKEALGEELIMRSGRGIALSPAGERLAEQLATAFLGLQAAVGDVIGSGRQVLRLAVCSSFGPGWLIPRLSCFIDGHPELDLQLQLYAQDPMLTDTVADAIISALPVQPGYTAVAILDEMLVAVHARGRVGSRHRLITTDLEPGMLGQDWKGYCARAGLALGDIVEGEFLKASHYLLAHEMARAGLGIALVPDFLARREIEQGAMMAFGKTRLPSGAPTACATSSPAVRSAASTPWCGG